MAVIFFKLIDILYQAKRAAELKAEADRKQREIEEAKRAKEKEEVCLLL